MLVLGFKSRALQQIAIIEMEGTIGSRLKVAEHVKLLRSLEENPRVRAVVLDIDSPGGSAPGSNYLYLAVKSLARSKPVVAFIRGLGASGAYMLSCPAQSIVAIPSAIVGSIGVISMRPNVKDALDRVGVSMNVTKSDRLKDMGSMFREATEEELVKEQALVDDLYDQFLEIVSEGRKMDRDSAKAVATGEVFTARKAKDLGLVDELGDLERAIDLAAELGDTTRNPVWVRPKRNLRDVISAMTVGSFASEIAAQIEDRFAARYDFKAPM